MHRGVTIARVAITHFILVAVLLGGLAVAGQRLGGALVGGVAMGASLLLLWGMVRTVAFEGRRSLLVALATLKVFLYLALAGAVITGRLVVDAEGFAAGVTCFVTATVIVTLLGTSTKGVARPHGARV